jgi:2Fe-2S ferredoxin
MPDCQVTFLPAGVTAKLDTACPPGVKGRPGSLLDIALANHVDIEHACGGVGACGTCHVIVRAGMNNLTQPDEEELDRVELAPGNTVNSRLACLAVVTGGQVVVEVPDWNRNLAKE